MKRYSVEARTVAYTTDLTWRTEWCVYDRGRRICTATSERQAKKIAAAMNASLPENVECSTCGGTKCAQRAGWIHNTCPDCTPENVECPTCGGTRKVRGMYHRPGDLLFTCPTCRTPENVEEP